MKTKIIVIGVIILAVAAGLYYYNQQNKIVLNDNGQWENREGFLTNEEGVILSTPENAKALQSGRQ